MENTKKINADKWVQNYGDLLFAFVYARVQNTSTAEDIVQETFLSGWRARDTYNGTASEKNWLYAICKNKIIDHYRKQSTSPSVIDNDTAYTDSMFASDGHFENEHKPTQWAIEDANTIDKKEFYGILQLCKNKLKQLQQTVFTLKYVEDVNSNEICETLGITTQNYWVLIHRAKLQIRLCLEKNWINA